MYRILKKHVGWVLLLFVIMVTALPVWAGEEEQLPYIRYQVYQGGWSKESRDGEPVVGLSGGLFGGQKFDQIKSRCRKQRLILRFLPEF